MPPSFCPVSVVIPTYNRKDLLKRALDSVVRQTTRCAEIIVIDDGSTDNTHELLSQYRDTCRVQIIICSQQNKGPAAARNVGISKASQPLIAFLDSDDHWYKRKIQLQYEQMRKKPGFLISHTKEKWLRNGLHLNQKKIHIPRNGDIYDHCLSLCAVGMSTVMVRKDLFSEVGCFDDSLQCCEDYDLWLRVSCRFPFLLIDSPLTIKEGGRDDQVSFQYRMGMDQLRIYSLQKLLDSMDLDENQHRSALLELERKILIFGNGCKKHGKDALGEQYLDLIPVYKDGYMARFPHAKEQFDE